MEDFKILKGLTLDSIKINKATDDENEFITFKTKCGRTFEQVHSQDCCESVTIEDINGDLGTLLNTPILYAEESSSGDDCETWTFYKLGTVNGWVDIRWYGQSNGYYSESVDFYELTESKEKD